MSDYESVLRVFWDADSLFRLASTRLPEEQSATLTVLRLTILNLWAERLQVLTPREFLVRLRKALLEGFRVT